MTPLAFRTLLEQLPQASWQAVVEGAALLLVDDQGLTIGAQGEPNAIVSAGGLEAQDAVAFRALIIARSAEILTDYYRTHPVTLVGFNRQVWKLIEEHGAEAFAAPAGSLPERTLFVEGGEVVAEPADSPRHRYGAYCELNGGGTAAAVEQQVTQWVESEEAYQRYLSMNVCRYTC